MGLILAIMLVLAPASYYMYGSLDPQELSDAEYIAKYKLLNGAASDECILGKRKAHKESTELWERTNSILANAMKVRGIPHKDFTAQKQVDQVMWYNSYTSGEEDVYKFLDSQYP